MRCVLPAILVLVGVGQANLSAQAIIVPRISGPRVVPFGGPGFGGPAFGPGFGIMPAVAPAPVFGLDGYPYFGGQGLTAPIYPGFGADTPVRMRPTVYPAIPLPRNDIIEARLSGPEARRASFTLVVPAPNARVWLDGVQTGQSGTRRRFVTPPLDDPDSNYVFQVRVEWDSRHGPQSRRRDVTVSPGSDRTIQIR